MDATTAVIETCETMEKYTALMERETEAANAMRLEEVTRLGDTKTALGKKLDHQIMVYELTPLQASLEEAYMELTKDEVEYHSLITTGAAAPTQTGGQQ